MKLLFDHNLSPRLVNRLTDLFTDCGHLTYYGLDKASDLEVWEFAQENDFILVTKDSDFHDLSLLRGTPPQVIWLRIGNCTTITVENLLREHHTEIEEFAQEATAGVLVLQ